MPLIGFEQQCIDLLRKIDEERQKKCQPIDSLCPTSSVKRGFQELRNLVSLVNYEGSTSSCK
jgi:hypothetical protein